MYLEKDLIIKSTEALRKNVDNKFFGLLSLFRLVDTELVEPLKTYTVYNQDISDWLDSILTLEDVNHTSTLTKSFRLSILWEEYIENEIPCKANFVSFLVFLYKFEPFETEPTYTELKNRFLKEFHLSESQINKFFKSIDEEEFALQFSTELTTKTDLKDALGMSKPTIGFESNKELASEAGNLQAAPFFQTLYAGSDIIKCLLISNENLELYYPADKQQHTATKVKAQQIIYFGAPGTGKSFKVEHREGETEDDRIRTTFHPDTDYSSFVGCYKPIEVGDEKEKRITYKFEGQCFAKAYVEAWKRLVAREEGQNINFTLIIEEINRGNCAQIFGDIFQLLDRDEKGFSQYAIEPDADLTKYLSDEFDIIKEELNANGYGKIATGAEMKLPPNLSIIATMNTSDQSLFPIDSAFKRRWDWEYVPIQYSPIDEKTKMPIANKIDIDGTLYDWGAFISAVNKRIYDLTHSEDKQLGYFFVKPDDGNKISMRRFVYKVVFYLWSDIYKDYAGRDNSIFKFSEEDGDEKNRTEHSFNSFFNEEKIKDWLVKKFIEQFVKPIDEEGESSSDAKLKYSINGEEPIGGRRIAVEVMKKYVESYYQQTPQQVVDEWNTLGIKVTHFVETEDEYNSRTDQSLRAQSVEWGDGNKVYVTTHGWVYNTNEQYKVSTIKQLIEAVNAKDWGIKVDIIEQ